MISIYPKRGRSLVTVLIINQKILEYFLQLKMKTHTQLD